MKKLKLNELSVQSFVTSITSTKQAEVRGGDTLTCTTGITRDVGCLTTHCVLPSQRYECPTDDCTTIIAPTFTPDCLTDKC
jgi:hypothetical protein